MLVETSPGSVSLLGVLQYLTAEAFVTKATFMGQKKSKLTDSQRSRSDIAAVRQEICRSEAFWCKPSSLRVIAWVCTVVINQWSSSCFSNQVSLKATRRKSEDTEIEPCLLFSLVNLVWYKWLWRCCLWSKHNSLLFQRYSRSFSLICF